MSEYKQIIKTIENSITLELPAEWKGKIIEVTIKDVDVSQTDPNNGLEPRTLNMFAGEIDMTDGFKTIPAEFEEYI